MTSVPRPTTVLAPAEPSPLVAAMIAHSDFHDAWGVGMAWGFALAERLHWIHNAPVPEGLGYRPSPLQSNWSPETGEDDLLCELDPTVAELTAAAEVIDIWLDHLRDAGLDY